MNKLIPTAELRVRKVKLISKQRCGNGKEVSMLKDTRQSIQQKFINATSGDVEWRDLPSITEEVLIGYEEPRND